MRNLCVNILFLTIFTFTFVFVDIASAIVIEVMKLILLVFLTNFACVTGNTTTATTGIMQRQRQRIITFIISICGNVGINVVITKVVIDQHLATLLTSIDYLW